MKKYISLIIVILLFILFGIAYVWYIPYYEGLGHSNSDARESFGTFSIIFFGVAYICLKIYGKVKRK